MPNPVAPFISPKFSLTSASVLKDRMKDVAGGGTPVQAPYELMEGQLIFGLPSIPPPPLQDTELLV